ncbi:DUF1707 domain-containing protein [Amycolatopsis sp. La24]|uniref:DUF1707 SHOCT-like domain-containing protein n=1 Tax=Amycolatopsis sp. La24 TaxID=3028304 RepID=UPI0023B017AD|nr:DUF1707 domain-containing protein [Amycolatopsis sp. La24]
MTAEDRVRCSDAERDAAARTLQRAAAEGRLPLAETEERTAAVYGARYRDEIRAALSELPAGEPAGPSAAAAGWTPVLLLTGKQLLAEVALLAGHASVPVNRRRRVVLAALLALGIVCMTLMAVHGIVGDGHEFERH